MSGKRGNWKGFNDEWVTYLPPELKPVLRRIWKKEVPKASRKSWKAKLLRKIVLDWLEWKGYIKK
jgi:hypothetical protein